MSPLERLLAANAAGFAMDASQDFDPALELERCARLGARVLARGVAGYPQLLACIQDPPALLYARGELPQLGGLAVVGSRRPTPYGLRMARRLAAEAAGAGIPVVSGLARGIDTEAHRAALRAGGITWAVLGSGLGRPYPPENSELLEQIASRGGAALSEAPLDAPPAAENFPRRNRILSGLCWAVVVVEGDGRSGALITARRALEQGREVFAVPGPADSPLSEGPHLLIKEGAKPACSLADILEDVHPLRSQGPIPAAPDPAAPETSTMQEQKILELTGGEGASLESLLRETGWELGVLARLLVELEMRGLIEAHPGQHYARR